MNVPVMIAIGSLVASMQPSQAADGDKMVYGAGMVTCAEWQKYRSTGDRANLFQLQAWIDGFLSGYNTAIEGADFIAPRPQSVAYYAWLDNYCAQNPLNHLMQATLALKNELTARAR